MDIKIMFDTSEISQEKTEEYTNDIKQEFNGIIFLKDRIIMKNQMTNIPSTFSTLSLNISSATSCSIKVLKLLTALLNFIVIALATTNVKTTINFKRYLIALFVLSPAKIWYCSIFL